MFHNPLGQSPPQNSQGYLLPITVSFQEFPLASFSLGDSLSKITQLLDTAVLLSIYSKEDVEARLAFQRQAGSGQVLAWASNQHRPAQWCLSPGRTPLSACGPLGLSSSFNPAHPSQLASLPHIPFLHTPTPEAASHLPCCLFPLPLPWCFKGQCLQGTNNTDSFPALPPTCLPSLRLLPLRAEEPGKYTCCHWAKSGGYGTARNPRE